MVGVEPLEILREVRLWYVQTMIWNSRYVDCTIYDIDSLITGSLNN